MNAEQLVMICAPDMSGHVRGKGFPLKDLESRLRRGIGWVPTNAAITAFDSIAESPFGSLDDLFMLPDPVTEVKVDFGDGTPIEHFFMGNVVHTDGTPWDCCIRGQLERAVKDLREETGLRIKCAFEMEFQFLDGAANYGPGFGLAGFRAKKRFGEAYLAALRQAGVEPDSFLREWGANQYEVTMHPQCGVTAADHALLLREMARATAYRLEDPITFTPLRRPDGPGNGVHIHISFLDESGEPATYDPRGPGGLSPLAAQFVAGLLRHLPAITALTAPSVISYTRLSPHRWSAAFNNLGYRDREASVRICPVDERAGANKARQFNFEFRAADSAASPHLQLAALIRAGLSGIRDQLTPPAPTRDDLSVLSPEELQRRGFARLPQSLEQALELFTASDQVRDWFGEVFVDMYAKHKQGELDHLKGMAEEDVYRLYEATY